MIQTLASKPPTSGPIAGETVRAEAKALAFPLIKRFEGYSDHPYLCPAGKWTIGWGSTRHADGTPVKQNDPPISEHEAELCLRAGIDRVDAQLKPLVKREPRPCEYAAMLSLAYNVGVGCHDGIKGDLADSSLLGKFNAGLIAAAGEEFLRWNKARVDGELRELPGLTRRRKAERELYGDSP